MPKRNLFLKDTLSPEAVTEPMNSIFSDTDVLAWFESLVLFSFFLFFRSIEELLEAKTENKKKNGERMVWSLQHPQSEFHWILSVQRHYRQFSLKLLLGTVFVQSLDGNILKWGTHHELQVFGFLLFFVFTLCAFSQAVNKQINFKMQKAIFILAIILFERTYSGHVQFSHFLLLCLTLLWTFQCSFLITRSFS